jgi:hypothetical protein
MNCELPQRRGKVRRLGEEGKEGKEGQGSALDPLGQ